MVKIIITFSNILLSPISYYYNKQQVSGEGSVRIPNFNNIVLLTPGYTYVTRYSVVISRCVVKLNRRNLKRGIHGIRKTKNK